MRRTESEDIEMKWNYGHTLKACYLGYITQAIVNNLSPLLFVTYQKEFAISVEQIALLISLNFFVQIIVDSLAARYVDRIGYRPCIVAAHICSVIGLAGLGLFPGWFSNPMWGLVCAICINAVGGGVIEVLISPMVEALPGDEKASAMSLLHSFYCWGHVAVVILSTVYFVVAGMERWYFLPLIWALVPLFNTCLLTRVPINTLVEEGESMSFRQLFSSKVFWVLMILMLCSGASEQAMSQWSSLFAETGLKVSKTMGDLLGPCAFAVLMGTSRLIYGIKGETIPLKKFMGFSAVLSACSYMLAVFAPWPLLSLIGCALCGFSAGIMWPGTFSLASVHMPLGGTAMFGLLALAGDMGCSSGPGLVGLVSGVFGDNLKPGLFAAILFPVLILILLPMLGRVPSEKGKG